MKQSVKQLCQQINKDSINEIKKVHYFFRHKYPRLFLLILIIIITYYLFKNPLIYGSLDKLENLSYLGIFIAGLLFSFGFTTPISVGLFIALHPPNMFLAALVGGFGAMISDLLIFKFVKISFANEFEKVKDEKPIKKIQELMTNTLGLKIKNYFLYFFAGFFIASPLPDELGIIMLAGLTHIKAKILGILSFILNTAGIFVILLLSS